MPKKKGEIQVQKSPAEFFAENQSIAGFDNLGKSLYTSIRELVENSLDACESIGELPEISVEVIEYTQAEFNQLSGLGDSPRKRSKDTELFGQKTGKRKSDDEKSEAASADDNKKKKRTAQDAYFMITVRDNGCGMSHTAIPNLLGRVLSGSKYGVRQTRGKFGLGAKMALIWSKKSSGQPIRITTAHRPHGGPAPPSKSYCVLDIDIYKNEPRIIEHRQSSNDENWIGTKFEVLVAGNWTTYKSRTVQYLQQLAIITPYAILELDYRKADDDKRAMHLRYDRRSEQMPPPAKEVKHHPSSVNNLVVQQLIQLTAFKTLGKFLAKELSGVSPAIAKRLLDELGFDEDMSPGALSDKQITRLVQVLRQATIFKAPDGSCLSPLGEYNLNLGIQKVLEPDLIATARDKPSAYEGHPFVVEAAVSLGGKDVKEGITVVRFANRIPLLFEGGADVSTRVANSKIRWASYKIDHKKDKVGVFVSIVSTKVPFKGTSKEYIGDDATEIQQSVKRALQSCCQQLRVHLSKRNALKDARERKSRLAKYIPDIGRSLFGLLDGLRQRKAGQIEPPVPPSSSPTKRLRLDDSLAKSMIRQLNQGQVTEELIRKSLQEAVDEHMDAGDEGEEAASSSMAPPIVHPVYLVPLYNLSDNRSDVYGSGFVFRPLQPIPAVSPASTLHASSSSDSD